MGATSDKKRRVFVDPVHERSFRRHGYAIVEFASPAELAELLGVYERVRSGIDSGYYASIYSPDRDYKAEVDEEIRGRFWDRLSSFLVDHEPVVGAFMVKHPGEGSQVPPHQDWIVTDETVGGAINCWFPLTPVTDLEGRMSVLPGSDRYLEGLRGSPAFPTQIGHLCDRIADELLMPVDVGLGQAIIYDNRLLHGTPPNRSERTRVVAYMSAVPRGASRLHYYITPDGVVEGYHVSTTFMVDFTLGDEPEGELFTRIEDYSIDPLSFDELVERHRRANTRMALLRQR